MSMTYSDETERVFVDIATDIDRSDEPNESHAIEKDTNRANHVLLTPPHHNFSMTPMSMTCPDESCEEVRVGVASHFLAPKSNQSIF